MKPKSLIILVAIMAVLAGLVVFQKSREDDSTIVEQVRLSKLLPEGLAADAITKIELHAANGDDEAVVLAKDDTSGQWKVASQFNAPIDQTKLDEYLEMLVALKGELRESGATDASLGAYDLGNEIGFRVNGYTAGADTPAFQLVVGKSPAYGTVFARTADSNDVYVVDKNPRQEAGIYNADFSTAPKPEPWINKKVLEVNKSTITNLTLTMPDKELAFEYREKPSEEPLLEPIEDTDEETGEDTPPQPVSTVVEYEWILTSEGAGSALKTTGLDRVLNKLSNLNASTVVDPSTLAAWGLEDPLYTCRIAAGGEDDDIVLHAGRPDLAEPAYVRVTTGDSNVIYKISKYDFEQLFPKGSDLFDLPAWDIAKDDIAGIDYTTGEDTVRLRKTDEGWTLEEPTANLALIQTMIDGVAIDLAKIKGVDYTRDDAVTGLESPAMRATFTDASGTARTLEIGNPSQHIDGYYVRLDGAGLALAVAKSAVDNVFVDPKDFYEARIFDIDDDKITHIEIARDNGSYALDKTEFGWTVSTGGIPIDADTSAVEDLTFALETLESEDLIFGDARIQGGFYASVTLTMDDGTEKRIGLEIEQNGAHPATVPGKNVAFVLSRDEVHRIVPPIESLLKREPQPDGSADELPATDEVQ